MPYRYVKPAAAEQYYGVDRRTIKKWARNGTIKYMRPTPNGQWLYGISDGDTSNGYVSVIYGRVSTRKQLDNLGRQLNELQEKYPGCITISDCASGLNYNRPGLKQILRLAFEKRLRHVYISYRDRLCWFGYDLIEHILNYHGATIKVDKQDEQSSANEQTELADDILSIITVFSARMYGKRSGGRRRRPGGGETEENTVPATNRTARESTDIQNQNVPDTGTED